MNKDNKVYANKLVNKNNNNKVFCSFNEKNIFGKISDSKVNKINSKILSKNIVQKINDIFNSKNYIYKADVIITMKNGDKKSERVIGKNNYNLITNDNKLISISEISDIQKK